MDNKNTIQQYFKAKTLEECYYRGWKGITLAFWGNFEYTFTHTANGGEVEHYTKLLKDCTEKELQMLYAEHLKYMESRGHHITNHNSILKSQ